MKTHVRYQIAENCVKAQRPNDGGIVGEVRWNESQRFVERIPILMGIEGLDERPRGLTMVKSQMD